MPDITFGKDGKVAFPTKYHGEVSLSKAKWEMICSAPERRYYPFNGEKVGTTLVNPDVVRKHRTEPSQFFYYKRFPSINLVGSVEATPPGGVYFAVVVDDSAKRICTVYLVQQPKPGKAFKWTEKK